MAHLPIHYLSGLGWAWRARTLRRKETSANRTVEINITETVIDRAKRRFDLRSQRPAGDSVYGALSG
jgi:hypothetical protein